MKRKLSLLMGAVLTSVGLAMPASAAAFVDLGPWMPSGQVDVGTTSVVGGLTFYNFWFSQDDVVTVTGISMGGDDGDDFAVSSDGCTGVPLGAWHSQSACGVTFAFTPTRLGLEKATVNFAYTSTLAGSGTVSKAIDAVGGPVGELCGFRSYPLSVAFWNTYVGQTSYLGEFERLVIRNCGTVDLHVSDIELAGADAGDFVLGPETCIGAYDPLPAYSACDVDLAFHPLSSGVKEATVTISSDGANAPQVLTLTGIAVPHGDLGVSISSTPDPDPAERGGLITYSVTVTNHGPSISEQAYAGFWFSYPGSFEAEPPGATCEPFYWGGPGMTCLVPIGDLEPNASATFSAAVRVGASGIPGEPSASALVGSNATADLGYDNNVASVANTIADTEPPTVRYDFNESPYALDEFVYIQCTAEDNAGIDWSRTNCDSIVGPAYTFDPGPHVYTATAYDLAGFQAEGSTTLLVEATYPTMRYLTSLWVTKAGVLKAALSLLDSAAAAEVRGNDKAEAGKLAEYRGLIQAQSGKSITPENAAILVKWATDL